MTEWSASALCWPWWRPQSGSYPDTSRLEAGDILLFAPGSESSRWHQKGIQGVQRALGFDKTYLYTHAAICLGSDCVICESVAKFPGVRPHMLPGWVAPATGDLNHDSMLVRRVKDRSVRERGSIAAMALRYLDESYGWSDIPRIAANALLGLDLAGSGAAAESRQACICSMLVSRSVMAAFPGTEINFSPGSGFASLL